MTTDEALKAYGRIVDAKDAEIARLGEQLKQAILSNAGLLAEATQLREALPALWGQYDDAGHELWIDPSEAMRAKCFDVVAVEMEAWREASHTDDGDLYAQAQEALGVLKPISERIAVLKGNREGK